MELKKNLFFAALGVMVLLGAATIAYVKLARPRAEIAENIHDFGSVTEDQLLTYTFHIKNIGFKSLEVTRVHPECACTATQYDRLIRPGRQGAINLSIKPFSLRGQFAKRTELFLNDPDHPKVVFTMKGVIRPLIEVHPGNIIHLRGKAGEDLHRQVRLTANLPEPWEISRYTNNIPQFIDVTLRTADPGRSYVLDVRQKRQEPGKY